MLNKTIIRPQPGPQTQFMSTPAQIAVGGGAAGGGKSYALMMIGAQVSLAIPFANTMVFRRTYSDLFNAGSFWPEAEKAYPLLGFKSVKTPIAKWTSPNRSVVQMKGLLTEDDTQRLKSSQLHCALIDEASELTEKQFWLIRSRLRAASPGIKPFGRLVSNPEPNWLCELIRWWLTDDGYADPEKIGIIRWFYRYNEQMFWFPTKEEAYSDLRAKSLAKEFEPSSFTFIPSKLDDNRILLQNDPTYYANLASLDTIERKRLLEGNWFVKPTGKLFKAEDFQNFVLDPSYELIIMTCDTAQGTKTANDYTVMQVWGRYQNKAYLKDSARGKFDFMQQVEIIRNLYFTHKPHWVLIEQAANGLPLAQMLRKEGVPIMLITRMKDKYSRAFDIQGYVQSGYVYLNPQRPYYAELMSELTTFSENHNARRKAGMHDDQVDALVDGVYHLLYNKIKAPTAVKSPVAKKEFSIYDPFRFANTNRPVIDSTG